jgi:hypothetical protein
MLCEVKFCIPAILAASQLKYVEGSNSMVSLPWNHMISFSEIYNQSPILKLSKTFFGCHPNASLALVSSKVKSDVILESL